MINIAMLTKRVAPVSEGISWSHRNSRRPLCGWHCADHDARARPRSRLCTALSLAGANTLHLELIVKSATFEVNLSLLISSSACPRGDTCRGSTLSSPFAKEGAGLAFGGPASDLIAAMSESVGYSMPITLNRNSMRPFVGRVHGSSLILH
jgi:hypothetical protein